MAGRSCDGEKKREAGLNKMATIADLEKEIDKLKERNRRVEIDKSWETSLARKILLAIFTYISIALYLKFIVDIEPWVNAVIPSIGFLLSTLTLSYFKNLWIKFNHREKQA